MKWGTLIEQETLFNIARRKTGEFSAVDENGKRFKIIKYTDFEMPTPSRSAIKKCRAS
jgi:hypothetical protein